MAHKFCIHATDRRCHLEEIFDDGDAVTIAGSVGRGGINQPDDVRKIQSALNDVSLDEGGPRLPLAVDGLVGPKSLEAIERFQQRQLGWSDGRVDTNNQTIAALNDALGGGEPSIGKAGLGVGKGAAKPKRPNKSRVPKIDPNPYIPLMIAPMLPEVLSCVHAAQKSLISLKLALKNKHQPWWSIDRRLRAVPLQLHFDIVHAKDINWAIDHILHVYDQIAFALARGRGPTYFEAAKSNRKEWIAYTSSGGYFQQGKRDGDKESPRIDTIYVCPAWLGYNYETKMYALLHELAHFCGPATGPLQVDDVAYLVDGMKYWNLKHKDKIRNAESYSAFAFRSKYGREPNVVQEQPEF